MLITSPEYLCPSTRELSELKKSNAVTESSAKEAMLSAELSAKEQQKALIEQLKMEAYGERENLTMQVCAYLIQKC